MFQRIASIFAFVLAVSITLYFSARMIDLRVRKYLVAVGGMIVFWSILRAGKYIAFEESVKYLGSGKVEVEFIQDVDYKNPKVIVKDSSGEKYTAKITHKDEYEYKIKKTNGKILKYYRSYDD